MKENTAFRAEIVRELWTQTCQSARWMVMVFKKFRLPSHVRLLATFDSPVLPGFSIKLGDFLDKASSSVIEVKIPC
jgi:hypothetical protein